MKNKWRNLFFAVILLSLLGIGLGYLSGEGAHIVGNERIAVAIGALGVQWHPEEMAADQGASYMNELFRYFIEVMVGGKEWILKNSYQ